MSSNIHQILQRVDSPQSFLEFTRALVADRIAAAGAESASPSAPYGPDAGGWENTTIETFLDAAAAWAEDSSFGESQGLQRANLWRVFATFLYCGKSYE
jgi:hypothetical protein